MQDRTRPSRDRRSLLKLAGAGAAASALGAPWVARAQSDKTMRIIVPFPAGAGTDLTARVFAKAIAEKTGRTVVVENRPGANGFIAAQAVLSAPPDGNTIFAGGNSAYTINVVAFKKLPYDPLTDFTMLRMMVAVPNFIIVPGNSPITTLAQLVAEAKKRQLNAGNGSISYQLMLEWFHELAGIKSTPVPFKGAPDVRLAVASGTVDYGISDVSEDAAALVRSGRIRALVNTSTVRSTLLPDVPSSVEVGYPDYLPMGWVAAAVSSKTPPDVVRSLGTMFGDAIQHPEVKRYYDQGRGGSAMPQLAWTPADVDKFMRAEIARWKRIATAIGYQPQ